MNYFYWMMVEIWFSTIEMAYQKYAIETAPISCFYSWVDAEISFWNMAYKKAMFLPAAQGRREIKKKGWEKEAERVGKARARAFIRSLSASSKVVVQTAPKKKKKATKKKENKETKKQPKEAFWSLSFVQAEIIAEAEKALAGLRKEQKAAREEARIKRAFEWAGRKAKEFEDKEKKIARRKTVKGAYVVLKNNPSFLVIVDKLVFGHHEVVAKRADEINKMGLTAVTCHSHLIEGLQSKIGFRGVITLTRDGKVHYGKTKGVQLGETDKDRVNSDCDQTRPEESFQKAGGVMVGEVVSTVSLANQRGTVAFAPKKAHDVMSKVAEQMKGEGLDRDHLDAGSRLQVPTFGVVTKDGAAEVVEVQPQILDGYPISLRIRKDEVTDLHFVPAAGSTATSEGAVFGVHERLTTEGVSPRFFMRSFFWRTTAWFVSLFTGGVKTLAGDVYARMPSFMKVKTLVSTKDQGAKVYLGSLKDPSSFLISLITHGLIHGKDHKEVRKNIKRAALQLGVDIEFEMSEDDLENEGLIAMILDRGDDVTKRRLVQLKSAVNKSDAEMDGMNFFGYDVKSHILKSNRPYQGRAMLQMQENWVKLIKFADAMSDTYQDSPEFAKFFFDLINNVGKTEIVDKDGDKETVIMVGAGEFDKDKVDAVQAAKTIFGEGSQIADAFKKVFPDGLILDMTEVRAQMIKGLFRPTGWLKRDVIIWDLNSVKDTSKNIMKKKHKDQAIIPANPNSSWVHGLLQDLGIGQMSFGTQPAQYAETDNQEIDLVQYANENWLKILKDAVKALTMIEMLDPSKEGQAPNIENFKAIKEIIDLKSSLELSGSDEEDIEFIEDDSMSVFANISSAEEQMISYFNDSAFRKSLVDQIKSALVELRMNLVSHCMNKIGLKMPVSDYLVDFNDLPPTYVNNKVTSRGFKSEMLTTIFPDNFGGPDQVQLMIDGELRPIPVVGLSGRWFWSKFAQEKENQPDAIMAIMYRYPVANRDMVVPVLLLNFGKFGWEPGIYANSLTIKEYFCGDTDGDRNAILPLDCEMSLQNNILTVNTTGDYGLIAAFGRRSDAKQVEIEGLVAGAQPAYFEMTPGATESVMGGSGKLIGGAALMQQNTKGILDSINHYHTEGVSSTPIPMIGGNKITHSFIRLLGYVISFDPDTVSRFRGARSAKQVKEEIHNLEYMRLSYNDQVKVIFDALSQEERQDLLSFVMEDIVRPYSILSPGLLEVGISSQKKDLQQRYFDLVQTFIYEETLELEGRDPLHFRWNDKGSSFRRTVAERSENLEFVSALMSLTAQGSDAPVCVIEGSIRNDKDQKNVFRELIQIVGKNNDFANEEWLFSRQVRETFQKETGYDIYRIYAMNRLISRIAKDDVARFIKIQMSYHMMSFLQFGSVFDIQFNSAVGMMVRDIMQITGAQIQGKSVEWIEALRLSDIEKLSNDKTRLLFLDDKSWGIVDSDNLDWAIARWSDRNKKVFLEIKEMLEPWAYNMAPAFEKPQFSKHSMLSSGNYSETLRVAETIGASKSIQAFAKDMFSVDGISPNNFSMLEQAYGMTDENGKDILNLVLQLGGIPSLLKSWTPDISSQEQYDAVIKIAKSCPKWMSEAVCKIIEVLLLKREAATLKLKVVTPSLYSKKENIIVSDKEYEETLLATFEDAATMNLNPSQKQMLDKWRYRLSQQTPDAATNRAYRAMSSGWAAVNEPEALLAFMIMSIAQNQACYTQDDKGVPTNFFVPINNVANEETYTLFSNFVKTVIEGRKNPVQVLFGQFHHMLLDAIEERYGDGHRMFKTAQEDIAQLNMNANAILTDANAILGQAYSAFFALLSEGMEEVELDQVFIKIFGLRLLQGAPTTGNKTSKDISDYLTEIEENNRRGFSFGESTAPTAVSMPLDTKQLDIVYKTLFEGAELCWVEADDKTQLDKLKHPFFSRFVFIGREDLDIPNFAAFPSEETLQEISALVGQAIYFGDDQDKFQEIGRNGLIVDSAINERLNGWTCDGNSVKHKWLDSKGKIVKSMFYQILRADSEVSSGVRYWIANTTKEEQVAQLTYAAFRIASSFASQDVGEAETLFCQDMRAMNFHCFKWKARRNPHTPTFWKALPALISYDDFENEAYLKLPNHDTILQLAGWWTRAAESNNPFKPRIEEITRRANKNKKLIPRRVMASMYQVGSLGLIYEKTWKNAREKAHDIIGKSGRTFNDKTLFPKIQVGYGVSSENVYWYWLYQLLVQNFFKEQKENLMARGTFVVLQQIAHEAIKDIGVMHLNEGMMSLVVNEELLSKIDNQTVRRIEGDNMFFERDNIPYLTAMKQVPLSKSKQRLLCFVDKDNTMIHIDSSLRSIAGEYFGEEDNARPSKGAGVVISTLIQTGDVFKTSTVGIATGVTGMLPVTMDMFAVQPVSFNAKTKTVIASSIGIKHDFLAQQFAVYVEGRMFDLIQKEEWSLERLQEIIDGFTIARRKTLIKTPVVLNEVKWSVKGNQLFITVPLAYKFAQQFTVKAAVKIVASLEQSKEAPSIEVTVKSATGKSNEIIELDLEDELAIQDEDLDVANYEVKKDSEPEHTYQDVSQYESSVDDDSYYEMLADMEESSISNEDWREDDDYEY